jgi:hypothetical protein
MTAKLVEEPRMRALLEQIDVVFGQKACCVAHVGCSARVLRLKNPPFKLLSSWPRRIAPSAAAVRHRCRVRRTGDF